MGTIWKIICKSLFKSTIKNSMERYEFLKIMYINSYVNSVNVFES